MWLKLLSWAFLITFCVNISAVRSQPARVYEDISTRNDSTRVRSSFSLGASAALQYNSSLEAPLVIGQEINGQLTGSTFQYGNEANGAADFNLFPEFALVADGLFDEHIRYRAQAMYSEFGFDWSDGVPSTEPYYRNSTSAWALKLSGGYQAERIYFLLSVGYGSYIQAMHGIGAGSIPPLIKTKVNSPLLTWGLVFGEQFVLSEHSIYLLPEIYYSNNNPMNQPVFNFIPPTYSLGLRLNLEFVLSEHFIPIEEKREFIYAEGTVRDCRTNAPIEANVSVIDADRNETIASQETDANGNYLFQLDAGKNYRFHIQKQGYLPDSIYLASNGRRDYTLPLLPLKLIEGGCDEERSNTVEGRVIACANAEPVESHLRFIDTASQFVITETESNSTGNYRAVIPHFGIYRVEVDAEGYFPLDETVDVQPDGNHAAHLQDLVLCDSVNLQSYFDLDRYNLSSEALPHIDRIAEYLRGHPAVHIAIEGHTDSTGRRSHNMMLSKNRAETLKAYLLTKGVSEKQIASVEWFGPDRPIADNAVESGREKNRRVDLKVVKLR
ncbi:MAG TPA: OmpA family protein [Candidatus Kapabacteria bacterium]